MAMAVRVRNAKEADFLSFIDVLSVKREKSEKDISEDVANLKKKI